MTQKQDRHPSGPSSIKTMDTTHKHNTHREYDAKKPLEKLLLGKSSKLRMNQNKEIRNGETVTEE